MVNLKRRQANLWHRMEQRQILCMSRHVRRFVKRRTLPVSALRLLTVSILYAIDWHFHRSPVANRTAAAAAAAV